MPKDRDMLLKTREKEDNRNGPIRNLDIEMIKPGFERSYH